MNFRDEDGFRELSIGQADQTPPGSVGGIEAFVDCGKLNVPVFSKLRPRGLWQVRHGGKIIEAALVHGLEDLGCAVGGCKRLREFGSLEIKDRLHWEAFWAASCSLIKASNVAIMFGLAHRISSK